MTTELTSLYEFIYHTIVTSYKLLCHHRCTEFGTNSGSKNKSSISQVSLLRVTSKHYAITHSLCTIQGQAAYHSIPRRIRFNLVRKSTKNAKLPLFPSTVIYIYPILYIYNIGYYNYITLWKTRWRLCSFIKLYKIS